MLALSYSPLHWLFIIVYSWSLSVALSAADKITSSFQRWIDSKHCRGRMLVSLALMCCLESWRCVKIALDSVNGAVDVTSQPASKKRSSLTKLWMPYIDLQPNVVQKFIFSFVSSKVKLRMGMYFPVHLSHFPVCSLLHAHTHTGSNPNPRLQNFHASGQRKRLSQLLFTNYRTNGFISNTDEDQWERVRNTGRVSSRYPVDL